jgi:hypothetical protein
MTGLIDQLQQDATDPQVPLTTLLRKVKVAAVKLRLDDAMEWVDAELKGYTKDVPEYRRINGRLKWWNPYRGYLPVGFPDQKTASMFESRPVFEAVTSLESTIGSGEGTYFLDMPPAVTSALSKSFGIPVTEAILEVPKGALVGIIEHVRGLVLDWALALERAGITGEGLSFSAEEQRMAQTAHISIGSFQGNLNTGEVTGSNARLVSHSTDQSTNIANSPELFEQIREAIRDGVPGAADRETILSGLNKLESAPNKHSRIEAYRQVLTDTASYMTILMPFMPALAVWVSSAS